MGDDGVIRHHYKTFRQKYVRYIDAEDAGWDYINSRKTMQAWRGSIRSFDEALASWNGKLSCMLVAQFSRRKFMPAIIVMQKKQQQHVILGQKYYQ